MWARLVGLSALLPAAWALARYDVLPHVSLCMFQNLTGRPCPGCGMTRAVLRLAQGDVEGSLRMHPLGIVLVGLLVASIVGTAIGIVEGGDPPRRFLERRGTTLVAALTAAFVALWIVRAFVVPSWGPGPV